MHAACRHYARAAFLAIHLLLITPEQEGPFMYSSVAQAEPQRPKMFLDIPTAAEMAGFSIRHFRRIIEEDRIPIVQIGRKFFILGRDFSSWESSKRAKRN
jgi:hypothetical protein